MVRYRLVVSKVVTNERDFQRAGLTTGAVDGEAVHGSDLSVRDNQGSGAEGLRVLAAGDRGDS